MSEEERSAAPGDRRLVVVHRGAVEAVDGVVVRLREAGLEAVALDAPGLFSRLAAFGTYRVRVAVPQEQEPEARAVLDRWDEEAAAGLEAMSRDLRDQVLRALVPTGLAVIVVLLAAPGWSKLPWSAGVGSTVFLLAFAWLSARSRRG